MDDLTMMLQDQERIEETATFNLRLGAGENPESTATAFQKSRQLDIPFKWAREADNADLQPEYSARGLSLGLQKILADDPDRAPLYKDHLPSLDDFARKAADSGKSLEEKYIELHREYEKNGVPAPARKKLKDLGFLDIGDGNFSKDGKFAGRPVPIDDAFSGPEEAGLVQRMFDTWKKSTGQDFKGWEAFIALPPEGKKDFLLSVIKYLEKENAVIGELNRNYPTGWIGQAEEDIQKKVKVIGDLYGLDLSDVNVGRLTKAGAKDADYMELVNILGARDIYKALTKPDSEMLASVGKDSSVEELAARLKSLRDDSIELRGFNLAGKIATGLSVSIPYVVDFMITTPLLPGAASAGRAAIGTILKQGGFTGLKSGIKALGTKAGVKAIGKAVGTVLKTEATRLPFYSGKTGAKAYDFMHPEPVTFLTPDGVKVEIPEKTTEDLFNFLMQETVRTYITNSTEWGGEFLPRTGISKMISEKLIPRHLRTRFVQRFVSDIANDPAKRKIFGDSITNAVPFHGWLPEIAEEYLDNFGQMVATKVSEVTGMEGLNLERQDVFGDWEEAAVIGAVTALQSTGGKALRIPSLVMNYHKLARFIDSHRSLVEAARKLHSELPGGEAEVEAFVERTMEGDREILLDPDDAEVLFQTSPEFSERVGINREVIDGARESGGMVGVSHNRLVVAEASNPEYQEAAEALIGNAQSGGVRVSEATDARAPEEIAETLQEEEERLKAFRMKVYAAIQEPSETAGVSKEAQKSFSTIGGFLLNYLDKHSLEDGKIEEAWDKLVVNFRENPESFVAPADLLQSVYHGTPYVWEPEPGFPHGRPRLDKIGTGEGAQAYGWGWYSAENQGVAKSYTMDSFQDRVERVLIPKLTSDPAVSKIFKDFKVPLGILNGFVSAIDNGAYKDRHTTISKTMGFVAAEIRQKYDEDGERIDRVLNRKEAYAVWEQIYYAASRIAENTPKGSGSIYTLDIPDEAIPNMLLWDERMDNQTPEVLQILGEIAQDTELAERAGVDEIYIGTDETVEDFYEDLSNLLGSPKAASEYLNSMGISGVKYKDGMSRDEGKEAPTYNYVIWDQDTLDKAALLERNGEKLQALQDAQNTLYQSGFDSTSKERYIYSKEKDNGGVRSNSKTGQTDASGSSGEVQGPAYPKEGHGGSDRNDGIGTGRRSDAVGGLDGRNDPGVQRLLRGVAREYYNSVHKDKPADDLRMRRVSPAEYEGFSKQFNEVRSRNRYGCCVSPKSPEELKDSQVFQSADGSSGIAVTDDGDIVAVHSVGKRAAAFDLMLTAIEAGGEKLDCYTYPETGLWNIYSRYGFIPICKLKFDEQYRPDDWNDEIFPPNNRPDIVFWVYNGETIEETAHKLADGTYKEYTEEDHANLKEFTGDNAYGEAMEYQNEVLNRMKQDARNTRYQSASESSALDAEYMKAVESGDMETAQRMVTEAAERAGYDVGYLVYRGDSEPRYVLKTGEELDEENGVDRDYYDVGNLGNGIYLTPARMYARTFGSVIQKFYLKVNAIDVASEEIQNAIAEIMEEDDTGGLNKEDIARELRNRFSANAIKGAGVGGLSYGAEEIAIQESNLAKLADPVTYDDDGNPIPLSQRFNLSNPDVRYQSASESSALDAEYMKAVESGDMETAQRMVTEAAEKAGVPIIDDSESTSYRVRRTAPPKKTVKAYKLFRTVASRPGELFPLFVGADSSVPIGVWLDAIPGPEAPDSKTGRQKVKSKLGALAYRPGWHAGDAPLAAHIGVKDAEGNVYARRDNEVWAEVEVAADVDYQPEADKNGVNEKGIFRGVNADLKHMPTDGLYRYKTNPNMMGKWIISGSMKINRIMSEEEVNKELKKQGLTPMPWESGPLNLQVKGLNTDIVRPENTGKILDPVTYDDNGKVIPLSQRFNSNIPDVRYQRPGLIQGSFTPAQDFNQSFNAVVSLFKSANASTLPHESAHWVKRMMKAMIDGEWADTAMIQDYEGLGKWLDRQTYESPEGTPERERERDEKFASAFEEFIRRGEAPNSMVESAFNTLKTLLTSIYKYVRGALLDVQLDDEIVSLFNRMLSTEMLVERDAPLREAVDTLKATYVELLGVSQAGAKDFQKLIRDAIAQMEGSIDGRKVRRLKALKKTWREEAQAIMDNSQTYKSWKAIKAAGGLNHDFVVKDAGYGTDIGSFLRQRGLLAKTTEPGMDVPLFAKDAGYASVDDLLADLITARTPTEFTAAYLASKEAEFNANFQLEGDDLSTKASIDVLDKVAELLERKSGIEGYRAKFDAFRDKVREHISTLSVAELQTDTRLVSSLKNSQKRLVKAITKKDYESSLKLLTGMRWNIQSLKERASARKEIVKTESLFRRIRNMKAGVILGDYHDALRELAYYFGFSKKKLKKVNENFRSVIGRKADEFGDAFGPFLWPEFLLRENVESYRKLTFAEFQDLRDFTKYIEGEGRDLVEAQKGTFANKVKDWIGRALEVFSTQPEKYDNRKSERNRIASAARYGFNWGLNLRTFLGKADGFQHMGKDGEEGPNLALRSHLLEGFRRMIGLETAAKQQTNPAVIALKATADAMDVKTGLPGFKKNTLHGYSEWTPEMVISACLNMGTESGRQRLMDGYGWDDADLGMIAKKLKASDLNHIQGIWDTLSGELWRATAQTFLEENHFRLDEIPASALTVTSSDGQVVSLRGGYYPIAYAHHSRTREVPMGFDPRALYSDVSATHRRRETIKEPDPVKLSLSVLESHIHSTAQYAALRMPVRMVLRVVMSKEYSDAFIKTQSPEAYENVLSIFKNIANPNPSTEKIMNGFEGWARSVLTATALMGNLKTVAVQFSSVTVGVGELGHYYADALTEFASDPTGTWETVLTNSALIRHRAEYYDIDLRASLDAISENGLEKARRKFAKAGYMLMRGADRMVAAVSWRAKYLQAEDQLRQKGEKDAFLKAVAQADDFVARTQGAARTLDLTPIQLTSIGRMVSPFITSVGAQYNTILESLGAMREGRLSVSEAIGALTGNLIAPVLFQAVLSYIVFGGLFGDDDDDIDRANKMFVKELLTSPFAGIPIVRDVTGLTGEIIASRMTGAKRNAYGFNVLDAGAVNAAGDIIGDLVKGTEEAYDGNAKRSFYLIAKSLGASSGMPVIHIYEKLIRVYENNGGEIPDSWEEFQRSKKK